MMTAVYTGGEAGTRVLVIEDDYEMRRYLDLELSHEGYEVDTAGDGNTALDILKANDYHIVLLDVMLPILSGLEVCRRARRFTTIPIIMLTAKDMVVDKVAGLDSGADDYLTKPFAIEELFARMRCVLRKGRTVREVNNTLTFKNLVVDFSTCEVKVDGEGISLTAKEYYLLKYLLLNKNHIVSREQILNAVWGVDYYGNSNIIDVYIRYLRTKFDHLMENGIITTVRGMGYVIKDAP